MQQASQSEKEQGNEIQQKGKPPERSKSPDLVFDTIDVIASQDRISPDHIKMISHTHPKLDHKFSKESKVTLHTMEDVEGYFAPALAPSPDFVITVNEMTINPQHAGVTTSEIDDTICNFPSCHATSRNGLRMISVATHNML